MLSCCQDAVCFDPKPAADALKLVRTLDPWDPDTAQGLAQVRSQQIISNLLISTDSSHFQASENEKKVLIVFLFSVT